MKKILGYFFIVYGVLLIPSGPLGGFLIGVMSMDSGDTSYFYIVLVGLSLFCWVLAYFLIKIGLKWKKGNVEALAENDQLLDG